MARYLLKASDEEFDLWRAAAGSGSLAAWIRGRLNAAADRSGVPVAAPPLAVMGDEVIDMHTREVVQVLPGRSFQPDFKKGGKR